MLLFRGAVAEDGEAPAGGGGGGGDTWWAGGGAGGGPDAGEGEGREGAAGARGRELRGGEMVRCAGIRMSRLAPREELGEEVKDLEANKEYLAEEEGGAGTEGPLSIEPPRAIPPPPTLLGPLPGREGAQLLAGGIDRGLCFLSCVCFSCSSCCCGE